MANEKLHFKFKVGPFALCVEGGSGIGAPAMPDTVDLTIRAIDDTGKLCKRESVEHTIPRSQIAAIGLAFLDVATNMAAETTWARSGVIEAKGQLPAVITLTEVEHTDIDRFVRQGGDSLVKMPAANLDRLRQRIHTLQRAQHLLEQVDDETAKQVDLLLTILETTGALPIQFGVVNANTASMRSVMTH